MALLHPKDYAHHIRPRVMTLSNEEFLRRFLQHVLPRGFPRIRYFGWLASRKRSPMLKLCRGLLQCRPMPQPAAEASNPQCVAVPKATARCRSLSGSTQCNCCGWAPAWSMESIAHRRPPTWQTQRAPKHAASECVQTTATAVDGEARTPAIPLRVTASANLATSRTSSVQIQLYLNLPWPSRCRKLSIQNP